MDRKAKGAQGDRCAQKASVFDGRVFGLALDSLACFQAHLASFIAGIPYGAARESSRLSEDEKAKLAEAAQQVAIKHAAAFAKHKDAVELGVALVAIQAAQLDQVLCLAAGDEPLSWKQCFVGLLVILAPLVIPLAIYLLNLLVTKLRG